MTDTASVALAVIGEMGANNGEHVCRFVRCEEMRSMMKALESFGLKVTSGDLWLGKEGLTTFTVEIKNQVIWKAVESYEDDLVMWVVVHAAPLFEEGT